MVVGLVAEGTTDFYVIRRYLERALLESGLVENLEVKGLQPTVDETSGHFGNGGWTLVRQWCARNDPKTRRNSYFKPLFRNSKTIDVIVIHLDADVIYDYVQNIPHITAPSEPLTGIQRGEIVRQVLQHWLWEGFQDPSTEADYAKHVLAAAVRCTETWLVSGLDLALTDPEERDSQVDLIRLKPALARTDSRGRRVLRKTKTKWRILADETAGNLDHIQRHCPHLNQMIQDVSANIP